MELKGLTKGGQLILEEVKVMIEPRAGDIVLFPPALLAHWSIRLGESQIQSLLVAWSSVFLEIWTDEGCQPHPANSGPPALCKV